ncbi:hypothetical protein Pmani_017912 [Petrolisthes manimaculis]|uniref:Uncharacterized protein n=1 Tax=Petrolisthes manimaculis TaxID=1843537 RepID=A0AAE1U787_9EUCA|nr:hypothetical protein Pmani_017912 [Petrolisthes manimaculis]
MFKLDKISPPLKCKVKCKTSTSSGSSHLRIPPFALLPALFILQLPLPLPPKLVPTEQLYPRSPEWRRAEISNIRNSFRPPTHTSQHNPPGFN